MKQMSTKDRLERKKYMGVWRWESEMTARMMSRFPNIVIRYMERKSPNMRGCCPGSSENPIRRNSETPVMFVGAMWWRILQGKGIIFIQVDITHIVEMLIFIFFLLKIISIFCSWT